MKAKFTFNNGFGLIEIVVTLGLIGTLFVASFPLLAMTLQQIRRAENESRATFLGQDAIEAAKNLRDQSWGSIEALDASELYHPTIQNGEWAFVLGTEALELIFTRSTQFFVVERDEDGTIVESGGTIDPNTRKVESKVTWTEQGSARETKLITYLSNFAFADGFIETFTQTNQTDFAKGSGTSTDIFRSPGNIRLDYTMLKGENFNSYANGGDPTGWVDTKADFSLAQDDALFKIYDVDTKVFGSRGNHRDVHSHLVQAGSDAWTNYEVSGRFFLEDEDDVFGITFFSKYPTADKYYSFANIGDDGTLMMSGRGTSLTSREGGWDSGVTPEEETWYRFRVQVKDVNAQTHIAGKAWKASEAEPASWQTTSFDDSATRSSAGTIGMWVSAGDDVYLDDVEVRSLASYTTPGVYESMLFDTTTPSHFDTMTWEADMPQGTSVEVRLRTAASQGLLLSAPWYGPTSGGDAYTQNTVSQKINSIHSGDRWMQYQVTLATTNAPVSPSFEEIHITYAEK